MRSILAGALGAVLLAASAAHAAEGPRASVGELRALPLGAKPWTGDFDAMLERRVIRVAVPYSRTLYFIDKGRERGVTADNVRDFERYVNKKHAKQLGNRPLTVYVIATTRDELLADVAEGRADIAAGNLTVTEARRRIVDFAVPEWQAPVREIVVTGAKAAPVAAADDLAGRTVHVRPASSYYESLVALNERLKQAGRPAVNLVRVPDALEDEDLLEMVNAGLVEAIVVDDWKARMWAQVLPAVRLNETAAVREGGRIGWAIRKGSPQLEAALLDFFDNHLKKQGVADWRMKQYHRNIRQLKDPTASAEWKRFEATLALFRTYGPKYGFDPLMLAAQGFQESQLDQNAKSPVGAIGVMQLMPATGAELKVGDITLLEPNIHAGAKYMDQLMTRYFADAHFDEANRTLFAFASYNAGPGRIAQMRKEAEKRGLDPNKWFNNVELVVSEKVGRETTTYVRNIYKYYAAYRLTLAEHAERQKAREAVGKK
ncbi:MAG: transporter substrate-binding domain-containing protein [Burkholderiales bacterium]|nr:transporter substrate-binding domain-containing protein [Burkholderiales bacterium]